MIDNQKKKKKEGEEHLLHWAKMRVKHFSLPQRNGIRRMFATAANARSSSLVYFFLLLRPEAWRLPRRGEKHPRQHLPWGCRPGPRGRDWTEARSQLPSRCCTCGSWRTNRPRRCEAGCCHQPRWRPMSSHRALSP